jgi:hypothetical protein
VGEQGAAGARQGWAVAPKPSPPAGLDRGSRLVMQAQAATSRERLEPVACPPAAPLPALPGPATRLPGRVRKVGAGGPEGAQGQP